MLVGKKKHTKGHHQKSRTGLSPLDVVNTKGVRTVRRRVCIALKRGLRLLMSQMKRVSEAAWRDGISMGMQSAKAGKREDRREASLFEHREATAGRVASVIW